MNNLVFKESEVKIMNLEDRVTQLEKRMTALELQLQARSREIPVIISTNGAEAMKEYFANYDI